MGCGASRDDVIKSESAKNGKSEMNGNRTIVKSINKETSTIPASEMYQSSGGPGVIGPLSNNNTNQLPPPKPPRSSAHGQLDQNTNDSKEINKNPKPEPIAFEVPADDNEEVGSLIKRHPPRRLRRMEDQMHEANPLTQETLDEKFQLAIERRNKVLTQRVASARQKSARVGGSRIRQGPLFDSQQNFENGWPGNSVDGKPEVKPEPS